MTQGDPPPDFWSAARRHHQDALLLNQEGRLPNADHFAGISAECALKALLLGHLGGHLNNRNRPTHQSFPNQKYGHLPALWEEIGLVASGRNASHFYRAITRPNPFGQWNITERYANGDHIAESRVNEHLAETKRILSIYEQAQLNGVLQ